MKKRNMIREILGAAAGIMLMASAAVTAQAATVGWSGSDEAGWQYYDSDGSLAVNCWRTDQKGLTYYLDENGWLCRNRWIQENGQWKYVDELGCMVSSVTRTIDGVQYTFGADGILRDECTRPAQEFQLGTLNGKSYTNAWADLSLTFPETAKVLKGNGSEITYALAGGEHVEPDDPELSYRITVDLVDMEMDLDRYLEKLTAYNSTGGYQVDFAGIERIGGYDYRVCRSSYRFPDGSAHHSDWYIRQIDGKKVEMHFNYYDELKPQADQVFNSIKRAE